MDQHYLPKIKLNVLIVNPISENIGGAEQCLNLFLAYAIDMYPEISFDFFPVKKENGKGESFTAKFKGEIKFLPPLEKGSFSYFKVPWYFILLFNKRGLFHNYDIIYANGQMAGLIGFFISKLTGKKLVIHLHQLLEPEALHDKAFNFQPESLTLFGVNLTKKIVNFIISSPNSIAISILNHIKKSLKCPEKVNVIYNAIDVAKFNSIDQDEIDNFAKTFGINRANKIVAFIGNLVPLKGVEYLIEAMEILKDSGYQEKLSLIIVGDVLDERFYSYKYQLTSMVKERNLENEVKFLGRINDVKIPFNLSDIVVLPSLKEGFAITIIEAMACGKPVIGTNLGGIAEIIQDRVDGILVPPRNPNAIADAINLLLGDSQLYKFISENGRKKAKQLDPETYTMKIVEVLQNSYKNEATGGNV